LVDQAYRRCKQTLVENRNVLDKLAQRLMEQETVDAEELQELLATNDVKMASIA
jgi:cell division protease FtsH